jgi:hypothetical protein
MIGRVRLSSPHSVPRRGFHRRQPMSSPSLGAAVNSRIRLNNLHSALHRRLHALVSQLAELESLRDRVAEAERRTISPVPRPSHRRDRSQDRGAVPSIGIPPIFWLNEQVRVANAGSFTASVDGI